MAECRGYIRKEKKNSLFHIMEKNAKESILVILVFIRKQQNLCPKLYS